MIISCPECSGPFEIPDDRIAALVQIECPHCSFRMILDFAAANDPSLVEEGMRMASGYRSAADYRAAASSAVAEPAIRPAPPPPLEEVTTRPEPSLRPVEPPRRVAEPAARPYVAEARSETAATRPYVSEPRAEAATRRSVTEIGHVSVSPPYASPTPTRGDTQVGPPPGPPAAFGPDYDEDAPTRVHDGLVAAQAAELPAPPRSASATVVPTSRTAAPQWSPPVAPTKEHAHHPAPPEEIETRPEAELPVSYTPRPAVEVPRAASPRGFGAEPAYDELDSGGEYDEIEFRKSGSVVGTVVVTILLVASLSLVGASLALKNTADPRPLLEDLIRQTVKR